MSHPELKSELSKYFHVFYDNLPLPVMLVRKDRTVMDRNPAAEAMGCEVGTRCIDRGDKEMHKGCLANQALAQGEGLHTVQTVEQLGVVMDSYWIPLPGDDELYVHFGIDITPHVAERLLPRAIIPAKNTCCGGCG